ncbi:MAG: GntR family transcriptional regulator [Rhodobacteraceae bacterium]|nr:GntR family transcriptional regulator [Paracoccaceae bacterium]
MQAAPPVPPLRPLTAFAGSLGQRVYLALKEAILSLAFAPGEILRKGAICAALGVSRSPVSEALARLAAEGLVDVVPQAGSFVARLSMADIREGAFLREAIELAAVERVAEFIGDDQLALLRRSLRLQEALVEDGDRAGFYAEDAGMHALILSFTGFRRLAQVSETAWLHVNRARRLNLPVPGRLAATVVEHRAIIEALAARDPAAARAATCFHLRQLLALIEPLERERPELFKAP